MTATYSRAPGETVAGGPYTISATLAPIAALGNYAITYNTAQFVITRAPTTLVIISAPTLAAGSVMVKATLAANGNQLVGNEPVTFATTPGTATGSGTTNAQGVATATLALPPGQYTVNASFAGDGNYLPGNATAQTLIVYQPTTFVIWGGNQPSLADAVKVGQALTFWGGQWEKQVTAGDYQANSSFKGYAQRRQRQCMDQRSRQLQQPAGHRGRLHQRHRGHPRGQGWQRGARQHRRDGGAAGR